MNIRQLAEHLKLGKSTVQRALSGHPGISESTRARVQMAATELGYHPDALFSILGSQSRRTRSNSLSIAYLGHAPSRVIKERRGVSSFSFAELRGKELGYNVELVNIEGLGAGKRLMDVLFHRGFVGVLLGVTRPEDHDAILANKDLSVVCCGRIDPLPLHTVQCDVTEDTRCVWKKLLAAGYRRIGPAICSHNPILEDDSDRYGTVLACQAQTLEPKDRVPPLLAPVYDTQALLEWFHREKPEAVLGFSNGQYYKLRDEGGVDMSRIAYATTHTSTSEYDAKIAGTIEPCESIAREAMNLMDQLVRHRSIGVPNQPLHVLLPGQWQDGASLRNKSDLPLAGSSAKKKPAKKH